MGSIWRNVLKNMGQWLKNGRDKIKFKEELKEEKKELKNKDYDLFKIC